MPVRIPKAWLWRAIRAKCYDCRAGYRGMDCEVRSCPLYLFLAEAKLDPILWWHESAHDWSHILFAKDGLMAQIRREAREDRDNPPPAEEVSPRSTPVDLRPIAPPPRRRKR